VSSLGVGLAKFGLSIAVSEPRVDLVPVVVDDARPTPMVRWASAVHAPFGECRAADTKIDGSFNGAEPVSIGVHDVSPWQL
jgi:hypothetical protein